MRGHCRSSLLLVPTTQELQGLLNQGLITQSDHDTQKARILSEMDQ